MLDSGDNSSLPPIPGKRYFTIGEVSELCLVQLKPIKRRGNRRYYQRHEVQLIRRIRQLLYGDGFTISGARNKLGNANAGAVSPVDTGQASSGRSSAPAAAVGDLIRELNEVVELLQE